MKNIRLLFLLLIVNQSLIAQSKKDYLVTITTPWGDMHALLYNETPQHKANFLKLVDNKFYDGLLFHRIINLFMIQGGDPTSRTVTAGVLLGNGENGYAIPAEITPELFHKKGTLAAARDNNPAKASSGCQFYVVQGQIWNDITLKQQMARTLYYWTYRQKNGFKNG